MPNTYTQLFVHCVFAVRFRDALIHESWEERLHKYVTGIVQANNHKMIAVNSVSDHLHMFVGLNPVQSISNLIQLVKGDSSEFINTKKFTPGKFRWQEGFGAFSNSKSQVDSVVKYILNQKEHHRKRTFLEEYEEMLIDYGVDFDSRYIFKNLEHRK
jgi:putative transposase